MDPDDIGSAKGQEVRKKAKAITKTKQDMYLNGRLGLVIDGTGKDYAKIEKQVNELRALGYSVKMIFVNTDLETALARNQKRSRSLPDKMVEKMWKDVQRNMGKFQNLFRDRMIIVDNSDGSNSDAITLAAYRKIASWVKEPINDRNAVKWIKSQQKSK
jgi:predicted kinase